MSLYGGIELTGKPSPQNIQRLDLLPMAAINEMQRIGIAIDKDWFAELSIRLGDEMDELKREVISHIPPEKLEEFMSRAGLDEEEEKHGFESIQDWSPFNIDSNDQLAEILYDVLDIGRGRQLKLTKSGTRISTGKKQLEQLKHEHPVVQPLLDYRERAKLKSTYSEAIPRQTIHHPVGLCPVCELVHTHETDRIHAQFPSTRTTTGRFSSKHPNLQNIPARTLLGALIRKGFIASPGMEFVSGDFSQVEMRLGGNYSLDTNLLRIFHQNLDPHTDTAMRAFMKTKDEVESKSGKMLYRAPCKNVNFGVFYGLSAPGLLDLMGVTYATAGLPLPDWCTLDWCDKFIKDWFELYPGVQDYIDQQHYRARRYGIVWDLFGRVRRVPEVYSVHERIQAAGLRQAGNMPIQSTAAGLNKIGMAEVQHTLIERLRAEGIYCWPMVTVHDELIIEVEQGYGDLVRYEMERIFSEVMRDRDTGEYMCAVPIKADGKVMSRWEK